MKNKFLKILAAVGAVALFIGFGQYVMADRTVPTITVFDQYANMNIGTSTCNGSSELCLWGKSGTSNIFQVVNTASTTLFQISNNGSIAMATTTNQGTGTLNVGGPILSTWVHKECNAAIIATIVSTDTSNICDGFMFDNTGASWISRADGSGNSIPGAGIHFQPGNQTGSGFSAVNDNGYLMTADVTMRLDRNTPIFDAIIQPMQMSAASSSVYRLGFGNRSLGLTTQPTAGCMFVASTTITTGNWVALCSTALASMTIVDTGVASSTSIAATGVYRRFRIETGNGFANFYIGTGDSDLALVAAIATNVPTVSQLGAFVGLIKESAGSSPQINIQKLDVWDQPYY